MKRSALPLFLGFACLCLGDASGQVAAASPVAATPKPTPPYSVEMPTTAFDAPAGTWTLVVLPDTQDYASGYPEVFLRQTKWISAHKKAYDIRFVAHVGDITDDNKGQEWKVAREAMTTLNEAGIPYALLPGNHDLGKGGKSTERSTPMNDYFKAADYSGSESVGYFEEGRLENSWHEFSTPTGKYLLVALEFGPRDAVLDWANKVIAERPDRQVIIATHAYLYSDDTRLDWTKYGKAQRANPRAYPLVEQGGANDGEDIWQKVASKHPNVRFVLSGHVTGDGTGYLVSTGSGGQKVHQILANYQESVKPKRPFGGAGYLRLMEFLPDGKTVRIKTYSPWLDAYLTQPDQQFDITLD